MAMACGCWRSCVSATQLAQRRSLARMKAGPLPDPISFSQTFMMENRGTGQEGMDAEVLHALLAQGQEGTGHLILGHAVLGIPGHIHDGVADAPYLQRMPRRSALCFLFPHGDPCSVSCRNHVYYSTPPISCQDFLKKTQKVVKKTEKALFKRENI